MDNKFEQQPGPSAETIKPKEESEGLVTLPADERKIKRLQSTLADLKEKLVQKKKNVELIERMAEKFGKPVSETSKKERVAIAETEVRVAILSHLLDNGSISWRDVDSYYGGGDERQYIAVPTLNAIRSYISGESGVLFR